MLHIQLRNESSKRNKNIYFKIIENAAGGNCLFWTINDFLKHEKFNDISIQDDIQDLRETIVEFILDNWDKWYDGIYYNLENHLKNINKNEYKEEMNKSGSEGTMIELFAAAELFGFRVTIIRFNGESNSNIYNFDFDESQQDKIPTLHILFNGSIQSGHYRLLELIKPKSLAILPNGEFKILSDSKENKNCSISLTNDFSKANPANDEIKCPHCNKLCKGKGGVKIHISMSHPEIFINSIAKSYQKKNENESLIKENTRNNKENQNSDSYDTQCEICDQFCKGLSGLTIHKAKKHKTEQRQKIVKSYNPEKQSSESKENGNQNINDEVNIETTSELKLFWHRINNELDGLTVSDEFNAEKCDSVVAEFIFKLREIQKVLPGPKNPNTKYYEMRKNKNFHNVDRHYKQTSNPKKQSKRDREKRKQKHHRDWIQWLYYNQRKRAVREISENKDNTCPIDLQIIHEKFQERWGTPNMNVIYQEPIPQNIQDEIDGMYNCEISKEDINTSIKRTSSDTAPGPDSIIPRTIKLHSERICPILSKLGSLMIKNKYVPACFKEARTILLYKDGDRNNVKNWRPITVCSILRRILEKAIDKQLRSFLLVSSTQYGFTNQPGTLINTSILSAVLHSAKVNKRSVTIILLDVRQAYDKVGYAQEEMSLNAQPLPTKLRSMVLELNNGNYTQIQTNKGRTKRIYFKCGILQGAPTSPQKFNASTKIVLDELNEQEVLTKYGYRISENLTPITNLAFADDTTVIGNSNDSAIFLISETVKNFNRIGLEINYEKSITIRIENGKLVENDLIINDEIRIPALKHGDVIKYLGTTFSDEIVFDEKGIIEELNHKLDQIVSTVTLRPDQKLKIVNMYIFPTLVYPFQTAPLNKVKKKFLTDIDLVIRHAVKEILKIPDDTPTNMLYSSTSVKGISLIRAEWEAYIQNINAVHCLKKANNQIVSKVRDLDGEIAISLKKLNLPDDFLVNQIESSRKKPSEIIRNELRKREYEGWKNLRSKGKGVELFEECPTINRKLFDKYGLTTSEWITYFKMAGSVTAVRVNHGRNTGTNRCRIPSCDEIETIGHVLGVCRQGELLRHNRHNKIVKILANALRDRKWKVIVEFDCISSDGSNRRVDIIAYDEKSKNGFIIDPTIRYEKDLLQPQEVDEEKRRIYEPCILDIQQRCKLKKLEVIGLFVGSRGTISSFFKDFCKKFKINSSIMEEVAIEALRGSCKIYNNHIYDPMN